MRALAVLATLPLAAAAQDLRCEFPVACLDDRGCVYQTLPIRVEGDRIEGPGLDFEVFAEEAEGVRSFTGLAGGGAHMLTVFPDGSARMTSHGPRPGSPVPALARTDLGRCEAS